MVDVWLPYGETEVCLRVPTRNFLGCLEPLGEKAAQDAEAEIGRALKEPIGSKQLKEIVRSGNKVVVVVEDCFAREPIHLMVSCLLDELNKAGVSDECVTVILGCGMRRAFGDEAFRVLGDDVVKRVRVISHDCRAADNVYVGMTNFGNKVYLNRFFVEADVKILTGLLGFHWCAGYGGGRSGVIPGVAGEETIKHNSAMILNANAKIGFLDGNPVHMDMLEAARLAKVDFILNVLLGRRGDVVRAFAGDVEQAFYEGVKLIDEIYRTPVYRRADIVVVSPGGKPYDLTLSQALMAVEGALEVVKRGGVVILAAECIGGYGDEVFRDWMVKFKDLKAVEREFRQNPVFGGHSAYHLLRALQKAQIILVSAMPDYYAVNVFRLKTARTVNEALNEAFKILGENSKVLVMPYGNFTLPEVKADD
ncbi:MAG: nickel-dependent lactate racemase [Candidatus Bathyarchaeia archaeon]